MQLREIRQSLRLTQKEFAQKLGLTQGYLSEIENKKAPLSKSVIQTLQDLNFPVPSDENEQTPFLIPIVDVQASAGPGLENTAEIITHSFEIAERFAHQFGQNIAIITVSGDSMEPTLKNNDWVLVHRQQEIHGDGIFVFLQDNELRVKRIQKELSGRILVMSDNTRYQTETYDKENFSFAEAKVIGRVVGIIKKQ